MKLIVITPSKTIQDETDFVTKMFESGLMTLHLRKPRYSTSQMAEYIKEIPDYFHNRIIIHSHHHLAIKLKLKGVHYTSTHLKGGWRYWLLRQRMRFRMGSFLKTRSYRLISHIYDAEKFQFDYYLTGTMFNTLTGQFYNGFYKEGLKAALNVNAKNIVGRGGCNIHSVPLAKEIGLAGLVFNSYIWRGESPYLQFMNLLNCYEANGLVVE